MTLAEYLESKQGLSYTQIIAEQPTIDTVGSITAEHVQEMTTILAEGLRLEVDSYTVTEQTKQLYSAVKVALESEHIYSPEFKINFGLPNIWGTFQLAVQVGIISEASAAKLVNLATYKKKTLNVTRQDCIDYFGPDWTTPINIGSSRQIEITLHQESLESTYLIFEMSRDGVNWAAAGSIHGLKKIGAYIGSIPPYGNSRYIRWRGEYDLDVTIEGI